MKNRLSLPIFMLLVQAPVITLIAFVLFGCGTTAPIQNPVVIPDEKKTVNVPEYLLRDCDDLEKPEVKKYTQGDTLLPVKSWKATNDDCKLRHKVLSDVVRKAFNIPVPPQENPPLQK